MSPIRPENRGRYPDDWPDISARIRFTRAEGRCECDGRCGNDHAGRCLAHLNHTPENCDDDNLMAACQRCHLAYDRHLHTANARRTRDERRGQPSLLDGVA